MGIEMASKDELEKMTVAQIKEKLKSRKLPISGAKSELINRLYESIMAEEKLLDDGPGGESIDLTNVNMDEVLGLDDEERKQPDPEPAKKTPIPIEDKKDQAETNTATSDVDLTGKQQGEGSASEENVDLSTANVDEMLTLDEEDGDKKQQDPETEKKIPIAEDKKVQIKTAARLGVPLSDPEKKAKRQARFGTAEGNNGDMEEKMAKRAARFGNASETEATSKESESAKKDDPMAEDKKVQIKTATRLGVPLSDSEKKASRQARFGSIGDSSTEMEKMAKRAARFGQMLASDQLKRKGISAEDEEKMLKRAKRFGMT